MAAAGFGTPQYEEPEDSKTGPNGAASPDEAPQELLDPNDPALTSELLDVNLEGDAYAVPVPPPDRKWRARLKIVKQKIKDASGQEHELDYVAGYYGKEKQKCYASSIEATLIDPSGKFDGLHAYDQWVATFMNRDGSTKVQSILGKLRKPDGTLWAPPGTKLTAQGWMNLFVKALAGEPECGIETQWEWSCQDCGKQAKDKGERRPRSIVGMHKFPPSRKVRGEFDPEMKCQVNPAHGYGRARVRIASVLSLTDLK